MKRVVLMGFMGAGKSTVGKYLAKELGCTLIDTDQRIEEQQGRKINQIFEMDGETAFRDMETGLLKELKNQKGDLVLSIGGGMPVREENRKLLQEIGTVIYLKTSKEEIIRRVEKNQDRPLLQGGNLEEKVDSLMKAREDIYIQTAQIVLVTDKKEVCEIAEEIQNRI